MVKFDIEIMEKLHDIEIEITNIKKELTKNNQISSTIMYGKLDKINKVLHWLLWTCIDDELITKVKW